ncbi:MAG: hypothetical protein SGI99_17785 [Pseudomonadota bacterium]|nr:hypothetical protein [Pseudomonadota bacterium]
MAFGIQCQLLGVFSFAAAFLSPAAFAGGGGSTGNGAIGGLGEAFFLVIATSSLVVWMKSVATCGTSESKRHAGEHVAAQDEGGDAPMRILIGTRVHCGANSQLQRNDIRMATLTGHAPR